MPSIYTIQQFVRFSKTNCQIQKCTDQNRSAMVKKKKTEFDSTRNFFLVNLTPIIFT